MHAGGVSAASRHLASAPNHYNDSTAAHHPNRPFPPQIRQWRLEQKCEQCHAPRTTINENAQTMGSALLTEAENQQLFEMLGPERISLAAGVAQLLSSSPIEAPNAGGGQWRKWHVGLLPW
uniref:Uncharacterized protein n=1 Tax=Ditylenchus dipsaci TaxID=166011 RepID=A0A915DZQ8_9BILA